MSGFGFDALTIISMAGVQTERIELGTAVIPTFPTHPLAMAKQALTAQVACCGRLTLGLGLSINPLSRARWVFPTNTPCGTCANT